MKKILLVVGLGAALCLPNGARAISLVYEEGPNIGKPYTGPVTIKMFNYDMGTVYTNYVLGTTYGYSGVRTNIGYQAGVTALDAQTFLQATGARTIPGGYGNTLEDSWGIARVTGIYTPDNYAVWTPAVKSNEITAMFWGQQDFWLRQAGIDVQAIDGVGMHVDFYEDPAMNYTPTNGALWRAGLSGYTNTTDGTLILRTSTVAGFIHGAGADGGLATEVESLFNETADTGTGDAYLSVYDSTTRDYNQFNGNMFVDLLGVTNADIKLEFTTSPTTVGPVNAKWLVSSQDPLTTAAVPEPMQIALLVAGGAVLVLRRRLQRERGPT